MNMMTVILSRWLGPIGNRLDRILGGNPNQPYGGLGGFTGMFGSNTIVGYGSGYGYQHPSLPGSVPILSR
jgi:hypothetical protein